MLSKWINQVDPSPTWCMLAEAVEHFDPGVAMNIRETCKLFLVYTIIAHIKLELDSECLSVHRYRKYSISPMFLSIFYVG